MENNRVTVSATTHQIDLEDDVMSVIQVTGNGNNAGSVHTVWQ